MRIQNSYLLEVHLLKHVASILEKPESTFENRSCLLSHCSAGSTIAQTPFSDSPEVHSFPSGLAAESESRTCIVDCIIEFHGNRRGVLLTKIVLGIVTVITSSTHGLHKHRKHIRIHAVQLSRLTLGLDQFFLLLRHRKSRHPWIS